MKKLLFILLFLSTISYSQIVYVANNKYEKNVKQVYITNNKYEADLIIEITSNKYKAKNSNKYWYFTENKYGAQMIIYITNKKYNADIKVYIKE